MRNLRVWKRLLGLGSAKLTDAALEGGVLVVGVVPVRRLGPRCGRCRQACPRYDGPRRPRRWRALDLGTTRVFIQAELARVSCPKHGVVVERVPWAAHGSGFTFSFEEQAAWLAVECSKTRKQVLVLTMRRQS